MPVWGQENGFGKERERERGQMMCGNESLFTNGLLSFVMGGLFIGHFNETLRWCRGEGGRP